MAASVPLVKEKALAECMPAKELLREVSTVHCKDTVP